MKIRIKSGEHNINFAIPHWFLTSRLGMRLCLRSLAKNRDRNMPTEWEGGQALEDGQTLRDRPAIESSQTTSLADSTNDKNLEARQTKMPSTKLPVAQMSKDLRRVLKQIKKQYGDFPLVEVESEDGDTVTILL